MSTVALPGVYRLTYQDWLRFPDDGRLYELVQGELFMTPPPNIEHQRISRDLLAQLLQFLGERSTGEVLSAPVCVRLSDDDVLEPDVVVVLKDHAHRIGVQAIEGAPDLVVEILSPGTARRDLGPKRLAYERAGVPEYWIVDPESESIEVLALEQGAFERHGLLRRTDVLRSRILAGFELSLDTLFVHRR